jgi:hypothetical protein
MLNLMEPILESLLLLEEALLQDRIERPKEISQKTQELGKLSEKTQTFDAKKERQIFEEARKEFKEIKVPHQSPYQK